LLSIIEQRFSIGVKKEFANGCEFAKNMADVRSAASNALYSWVESD